MDTAQRQVLANVFGVAAAFLFVWATYGTDMQMFGIIAAVLLLLAAAFARYITDTPASESAKNLGIAVMMVGAILGFLTKSMTVLVVASYIGIPVLVLGIALIALATWKNYSRRQLAADIPENPSDPLKMKNRGVE